MPKVLSEAQIEFFRENGHLHPFDGIDAKEAAALCRDLEAYEKTQGNNATAIITKSHLLFSRAFTFTRRAAILDAVEDLIGPDILFFSSRFWIKPGRDGSFVSWHQDSAYFGLEPNDLVTVWLALTDSTTENGCLRVIPRTHLGKSYTHDETPDERNLLARSQSIEEIDDGGAVDLELKAGQFSIHHERLVHGSLPNETERPRIGLGLFCMPTRVRSTLDRRFADLARGTDTYLHWDHDPTPETASAAEVAAHVEAAGRRYVDPNFAQETRQSRRADPE
ncbi:MAG: phytanoyl-CoA dioxygenase family protein [Pseudomonadota bacterium]|nr:phytanoyl-CoA dioxygenase family protein [Pseudomonadota bacterium]